MSRPIHSSASIEAVPAAISDDDFALLTALLRERTGIFLPPGKKPLLAARLLERMRALGLSSFGEYHRRVLADPGGELTRMTDALCTHETRFFRDAEQLDHLVGDVLPAWTLGREGEAKGSSPRRIRVWSAGCSTGEEAFTIAMLLLERLPTERGFSVEVLGTDISTAALDRARAARWPEHRIQEVPEDYRRRYFVVDRATGDHEPTPELRNVVRFHKLNLFDWYYPVTGKFDLVLCRNVLIYFDAATRATVARRLVERLAPAGHLLLGMTESLLAIPTSGPDARGAGRELAPGLPPLAMVGPATYAFSRSRPRHKRRG